MSCLLLGPQWDSRLIGCPPPPPPPVHPPGHPAAPSMSALLSQTLSDALEQVRPSYDRILNRLSRCAMSVMNLAVRLLQLLCVTLLYFSAVKVSFARGRASALTHRALSPGARARLTRTSLCLRSLTVSSCTPLIMCAIRIWMKSAHSDHAFPSR